jgi:hypothetical protein
MSGGIGSFAAATRVAERYGTDDMVLLFADTLVEDEDLHRFLSDAVDYLGVPLVRVCDGRTPWQVFADVRWIGNSRLAPCSKWLKQIPCRRWLQENTDPADTVLYVGLDWAERRREPGVVHGWAPWRVEFPMTERPYLTKEQMLEDCRARGLRPPRLYELGYSHNNCGGKHSAHRFAVGVMAAGVAARVFGGCGASWRGVGGVWSVGCGAEGASAAA